MCGLSLVVIHEFLIAVPFLIAVAAVHGLSCSVACGIFLEQGSNLCPLHWQAGSQPLGHRGSPDLIFLSYKMGTQIVKCRSPPIRDFLRFT